MRKTSTESGCRTAETYCNCAWSWDCPHFDQTCLGHQFRIRQFRISPQQLGCHWAVQGVLTIHVAFHAIHPVPSTRTCPSVAASRTAVGQRRCRRCCATTGGIVASARDPSLRPAKAARALIVNVGASSDPRRGGNSFSPCEVTPDKRLRAITDPDRWSVETPAPICPITHNINEGPHRGTDNLVLPPRGRKKQTPCRPLATTLRLQLQAAYHTGHGMSLLLWWRPFKPRLRATVLR